VLTFAVWNSILRIMYGDVDERFGQALSTLTGVGRIHDPEINTPLGEFEPPNRIRAHDLRVANVTVPVEHRRAKPQLGQLPVATQYACN
jgi:hypothetical protein